MNQFYYSNGNTYWQKGKIEKVETQKADITITGEIFQTLQGFGGCFNELGMISLNQLGEAQRNRIFDQLFGKDSEMKFEYCRLPIGASDYAESWYSHNEVDGDYEMAHFSIERDRKYLIPYIKEALKRNPDLKLFASPWSPPTWMKFPKAYNYGKLVWEEKNLKAYALYLAKFVEEYAKQGITIHQIHVQNEVAADQKFPSCKWTGEELKIFIRDYLGPMFEQRNLATEIWLGTLNCPEYFKEQETDFDTYAFRVLMDEKAKSYIRGVSYQWAGKLAVQRSYDSFPGIPIIQSENECGDGTNDWTYAKYVFKLMQHYFRNGVVGYIYWNMVLGKGGQSTWGWNQNSMITIDGEKVIYNPEYYVMQHICGFVGKGSVRLGIKGCWSGNALAFQNADKITLCVLNPLGETRKVVISYGGQSYRAELKADSINTICIIKGE